MGTTRGPTEPLRTHRDPQQAVFIELLFDVVFVFAFTRLSERLVDRLDWIGFCETLVLTAALWRVWYRTARMTNRYAPSRPVIQFLVIATMFASLMMAVAIPRAFAERGAVFAGLYVGLQMLRHVWLVLLGGDRDAQLVSIRILFWATISSGPWIAGAFAEGGARLAWWTVGVGIDYLAGILDFPTPRLGRAGLGRQRIAAEHLAERYRQILIIGLGETLLASGIEVTPYGFDRARMVALTVSFAITVLLALIYFHRAGQILPAAILASKNPGRVGELGSVAHLIMVLGIVISAVGDKLIIDAPLGRAEPAWVLVIFVGPALFLAGRALLEYAIYSRVAWPRPVGLLLLATVAPATIGLPPVVVAAAAAAVLAIIAVTSLYLRRMLHRELAPPPRT
ncbi:MAG TPA: low temperature requirement protein A [Micromonosporaceae bacterium]